MDHFPGKVALTFDDGPHKVHTPRILDSLARANVKATFFVTGENATRYPQIIQRIVREGHQLGNHSWKHDNLRPMTEAQVGADLKRTQEAVDKALGYHYELQQMRPPYGAFDVDVRNVLSREDDALVMWNVDSEDWKYRNDDQRIINNIFSPRTGVYANGGVVLMHDIHPQATRVIDRVIERLEQDSFEITTTGDLLAAKYGDGNTNNAPA
jgi:peptidoglycan-N-acetylglucosamine deacetylase